MKSNPDIKSTGITIIPFAEKITLIEKYYQSKPESSKNNTKWYKTNLPGFCYLT